MSAGCRARSCRLQGDGPTLNPRQRVNVGLVMFVSQALQVLVVSLALAGFFVVFGALTIGPEVARVVDRLARHPDRSRRSSSSAAG